MMTLFHEPLLALGEDRLPRQNARPRRNSTTAAGSSALGKVTTTSALGTRAIARAVAGCLCLLACGNEGRGVVTGNVKGRGLTVIDAISQDLIDTTFRNDGGITAVIVRLENQADLCALETAKQVRPYKTTLHFAFFVFDRDGNGFDLGEYDIPRGDTPRGQTPYGNAWIGFTDGRCSRSGPDQFWQLNGKVRVTEYSEGAGGKIAGTFDLYTYLGDDHLVGRFDAPHCAPAAASSTSDWVCR